MIKEIKDRFYRDRILQCTGGNAIKFIQVLYTKELINNLDILHIIQG